MYSEISKEMSSLYFGLHEFSNSKLESQNLCSIQCTLYTVHFHTYLEERGWMSNSQSTQSAGPVRFLLFCSTSIFLLASLVAGRRPQCNAGADQQGMYSTIPIHWNIKSAPARPGRSRVGPALYAFSLMGQILRLELQTRRIYLAQNTSTTSLC